MRSEYAAPHFTDGAFARKRIAPVRQREIVSTDDYITQRLFPPAVFGEQSESKKACHRDAFADQFEHLLSSRVPIRVYSSEASSTDEM